MTSFRAIYSDRFLLQHLEESKTAVFSLFSIIFHILRVTFARKLFTR